MLGIRPGTLTRRAADAEEMLAEGFVPRPTRARRRHRRVPRRGRPQRSGSSRLPGPTGSYPGRLITTAAVVAETGWLIDRRLGAATEAAFYRSVVSGGFDVE